MGGSVVEKKEVYTTQQPDGTLVTTTTVTTTQQDNYAFGQGWQGTAPDAKQCVSEVGILRLLQIIVGFIVVGCVAGPFGGGPYTGVLGGQTYVLVAVCLCVCVTFLFLVVFFLSLHRWVMADVPWRSLDLWFSLLAVALYIAAFCLECYYASGTWQHNCNQWISTTVFRRCPLVDAWIAASVFLFINIVLYAIGAYFAAARKHLYI